MYMHFVYECKYDVYICRYTLQKSTRQIKRELTMSWVTAVVPSSGSSNVILVRVSPNVYYNYYKQFAFHRPKWAEMELRHCRSYA